MSIRGASAGGRVLKATFEPASGKPTTRASTSGQLKLQVVFNKGPRTAKNLGISGFMTGSPGLFS